MKFREHRGGLRESMRTCVELEPTLTALRAHLVRLSERGYWFDGNTADVQEYFNMPDDRTAWPQTCIVIVTWRMGGRMPIGYTDRFPDNV